jgi:hypothetical protein
MMQREKAETVQFFLHRGLVNYSKDRIMTYEKIHVNVNEFFYHLTANLFASNDNELVCHFCCFDSEKVYHLASKFRETLVVQHFPHKISLCLC